ncbi:hypothetical protein C7I87_27570 [Mesorhizobium sp. SARCC-RB16n]|uniref:hypothetical protein n=1 Tax=Mesorhizobium sp. SARCC-RB16n TaxID=2116687 RepID=UPI00122F9394|nr:hypothetical protein [Mesorhizobium sp. SARCC-RB16n]KAA3447347.1 hypothetical protein C7I87_27570 [Mesorhizobium sp. SARCC-RB16n]
MTDLETLEIETVVRLLSKTPRLTRQARYEECTAIVARHLSGGSEFLFALIKAAIKAGVHQTPLIEDAVSFLDDAGLARLAFFLQGEAKRGTDVDDLLSGAALQQPNLFPDDVLANIPDFEDWLTHADPRSPPGCHHLVFEGGAPDDPFFPTRVNHPTWHLPTAGQPFTIGGEGTGQCPTCSERLAHLITLDNFGVSANLSLPRLRIETCHGSLEVTFYVHDEEGRPTPIAPFHSDNDFTPQPMTRKSTVRLAPTPPRWLRQSYGTSNSRQNLFRLGGLPSWVQGPQFPVVPGTDRPMKFLLQFDSLAGFFWGSGGMLYIFWDEESRMTCHVPQYT